MRVRERGFGHERGRLEAAVERAASRLLSLQKPDGHWCAELEGDTILESEYALLLYYLGQGDSPRFHQLAAYLRSQQQPDGGWSSFPGGPPVVSVSAKAYFVLKLAGDDPEAAHLRAAREQIRRLGGLDACNSYTRLLFAIFGVYPWRHAPAIPPELILLPRWFYFNIYEMSAWSRAIVVPLSIVWASKPHCPVPDSCRLDEINLPGTRHVPAPATLTHRSWGRFFTAVDRLFKLLEALRLKPLRRLAIDRALTWTIERFAGSAGLGAIFPPIMNAVIALTSLGREVDDPLVAGQLRELEKLEILEHGEMRLQPCCSPVWDTALSVNALLAAGVRRDDPAVLAGSEWLIDREVRREGDWKVKNPDGEPGGWYFEYANEFYPDCDDTAEVLCTLSQVRFTDKLLDARRRGALERGLAWQLSMQSTNGGWGAFDKNNNRRVLEFVPFADHDAMLDPPTVDISARTVGALVIAAPDAARTAIDRGIAFLRREQETDGSWYGRWGSNYIYGTWLALSAFGAVGEDLTSEPVRRGVEWLLAVQHEDGGWGESLLTYQHPELKGKGPTTAAQTAWAVLGLLTAGAASTPRGLAAIERGVGWLLDHQRDDGVWHDEHWTGTGFPQVFYLRYELYPSYFPLEALAACRDLIAGSLKRDRRPPGTARAVATG